MSASGTNVYYARLYGNPLDSTSGDEPMQSSQATISSGGIIPLQPNARQAVEVQGSSGQVDTNTVTPIPDGVQDKQEVVLVGVSDIAPVNVKDGGNISINGDCLLSANRSIALVWNGTVSKWVATGRS